VKPPTSCFERRRLFAREEVRMGTLGNADWGDCRFASGWRY
jgi:hypothetical protein